MTIPNSVTTIGNYAFYGCTGLTSVTIPNSVTTIGSCAFHGCSGLTSMTIPNSVTEIGSWAFCCCSDLASISVEKDNKVYDSRNNCNAIIHTENNTLLAGCKNTVIPNNVTSIGDDAFYGCTGLTSVAIPNSVTSIGNDAFYGCTGLTSVAIPNSVTSIGDNAFYYCTGLTSVTIPNSVTSIGESAFYRCTGMAEVISEIEEPFAFGSSAFSQIASTCSLTVPTGTKDAYIAAGWTEDVFKGGIVETASPSSNITFADANVKAICVSNWDTNGDGELSEAEAAAVTALGEVFKWNTDIISFNELQYFTGLESLNNYAFNSCENLTCITIPSNVTSIGNYVFAYCRNLDAVTIPNNVTNLGNGAFSECNSFTSVSIPNSVTSIGEMTFRNCKGLTSVTIPNSVIKIGKSPFQGCSGLKTIIVEEENKNYDSRNNCNAIIKTASNTLIQGCENTIIPSDVTYIGDGAFFSCGGLISITIPNSVTSIGKESFRGCDGLKSIIFSNNLKSIGDWAFATCLGLTSFTIPSSVTSIGEYAFSSCRGLTSIIIPNSVTSIGTDAFSSCINLTSITIPNSLKSISNYAFLGCEGLVSVIIPNGVTVIGNYSFKDCDNLTSVTIPNSVTKIGQGAFRYCRNLACIVSEIENPYTFGSDAFDRISDNCTLIIPSDTKDAYIAAGWTEDVFKGGIFEVNDPALANYLAIEDSKVFKGGSVVLPVNMNNTESITALQFEVALPAGVILSNCQLTDRKGDDHKVTFKKLDNGNYQVAVISLSKDDFSGTEGALVNLTLNAEEDMAAGDHSINITNIELTTTNGQAINPMSATATLTVSNIKMGDANGDGKISITDAVAVVSHILGDDIEGFVLGAADVNGDGEVDVFDVTKIINIILTTGANSAKVRKVIGVQPYTALEQLYVENSANDIMVNVNNAGRFTSFQMNVEVPDGVELTGVQLMVSETGHILRYTKVGENDYRIIALSLNNTPLSATAEGLLKLDLSNGGEVQINDILFVTPQGEEVQMESLSGNIATDIADIKTPQNTEIYDLSGRKLDVDLKQLPKGLYIINGKKVMAK